MKIKNEILLIYYEMMRKIKILDNTIYNTI